jgi:hypothetical protein
VKRDGLGAQRRATGDAAAAARPEYRVLIWRGQSPPKTLVFAEPVDALTAGVEYLREGYQVRLGGETVERLRGDHVAEPVWFPSLPDWRLLAGMLGRALESPGFFHPAAEQAGRSAAERLENRIRAVIHRIERAL